MNVYEAIETVYVAAVQPKYAKKEHADALATVRELLNAYDALAPDWDSAPDMEQWYCIDAFGGASWTLTEPFVNDLAWHNTDSSDWWTSAEYIELPIGIDWRLCKWQRPADEPETMHYAIYGPMD